MKLSLINLEKAKANRTMLRNYLKEVEGDMINTFSRCSIQNDEDATENQGIRYLCLKWTYRKTVQELSGPDKLLLNRIF